MPFVNPIKEISLLYLSLDCYHKKAGRRGFFSGILQKFGPSHVSEIAYLLKDFVKGKVYR